MNQVPNDANLSLVDYWLAKREHNNPLTPNYCVALREHAMEFLMQRFFAETQCVLDPGRFLIVYDVLAYAPHNAIYKASLLTCDQAGLIPNAPGPMAAEFRAWYFRDTTNEPLLRHWIFEVLIAAYKLTNVFLEYTGDTFHRACKANLFDADEMKQMFLIFNHSRTVLRLKSSSDLHEFVTFGFNRT